MDYDVMMTQGRAAVIAAANTNFNETIGNSDLDSIWSGGMMELNRVMFLDTKNDRIYVVTFDKLNDNTSVKVYSTSRA